MAEEKPGKRACAVTGKIFRRLLAANTRLIRDVTDDIHAASRLDDKKFIRYGLSLLGDAISDGTDLIRSYYEGGERRRQLGAAEERGRHWQSGSPVEILENMRLTQSHYIAMITALETLTSEMEEQEARDLDRKRIQALREMALRIQTGKMAIVAKEASFWNDDLEKEFKDALEYRLSR